MLDPQVVVNLLPEFGVGVNLVRHDHWLGDMVKRAARRFVYLALSMNALCSKTNEFHKRPSFGVDCSSSARNEEPSSRGALNSRLASVDSGLQVDLEIALSGASAKVKPLNRAFQPGRKCVETSDDVIEDSFTSTPARRYMGL
jgi:hypothetical protein